MGQRYDKFTNSTIFLPKICNIVPQFYHFDKKTACIEIFYARYQLFVNSVLLLLGAKLVELAEAMTIDDFF